MSGTTDDTSTELDPTYTYERPGNYTATLTVTDPTGQRGSASVDVQVTSGEECPTGPVRSDEFDGDALDTNRWEVLRSADNFEVTDGQLRLPIGNGSIYGPGTSAQNIIVQDTPEGAWQVTAKITAEQLTENYHQAGLRVYSDDDNWASVHMISAGGQRDIEFIYESAGQPRNEAADKLGGIPATAPTTYYVRLVSDGEQLTAFYSFDGDEFLPVGRPGSLTSFANPRIGPAALSDMAPSVPDAFFDWIRFEPDGSAGGGTVVADEFNGSALESPPWEVVRQNQDLTVSGGALRIPAAPGDIYGAGGNANNLVLRDAPDGPWEAVTKLSFEGTAQYHQAGLLVYGDDDNFTKFGRIAHTTTGDEKFEFIYENAGVPRNDAADSTANLDAAFPLEFFLRIRSDGTNLTGAYSTDGVDWTPVGRPAPLPADARIGAFAFNNAATSSPEAAFDFFRLTTGSGGGGGGPTGPSRDDQFDGSTLDTTRWNAIVRGNPERLLGRRRRAHDHHRAGRHLHGRHGPAAQQLHPAVGRPRRRRLDTRDEAVGHDQRRLRPGRPDRPRGRRQLRQARRDLRRRRPAHQPHRAALRDRRRGAGAAAERGRARGHDRHLAAPGQERHHLLGRVLIRRRDLDGYRPDRRELDGHARLRPVRVRPAAGRRGRHRLVRLLHARRTGRGLRVQRRR